MRVAFLVALSAALIWAVPVWAEKRAIVIGNADYRHAPDLSGADMRGAVDGLRAAGFHTQDGTDMDAGQLRVFLTGLVAPDSDPAGRIVVLNGRFLHDSGETWFMGVDARQPGALDVGLQGVPLSQVMRLIADGQPGAALILGTDGQEMPHGLGLENGIGRLEPPRKVAVMIGTPAAAVQGVTGLVRGMSVARVVAADPTLQLLPGASADLTPAISAAMQSGQRDTLRADQSAWVSASAANSAQGYQSYLNRFPRGLYSAAARERLLRIYPQQAAVPGVKTEQALNLSNPERATIQRWLSRLDYDTGTADAVFGQRTRSALAAWQKANGKQQTGYLDAEQVRMIRQQIAYLDGDNGRRDRAYWEQTGARGNTEGLTAYLRRYPYGLNAGTAQRMLDEATGQVRANLPQGDDATWRWARQQGSVAAYETYLDRYPHGRNAAQARMHLQTMRATTEAARREETAQMLDLATRRLIEERLRIAGMKPGPVDGDFTSETRAALSRYQAERNLHVTGFVTQETITHLLADVLQR